MHIKQKSCLALFLTLILVLGLLPGTAYADFGQPSGWAVAEVQEANSDGLIPQGLEGNYQNDITRLEFCKLMMKLVSLAYDYDVVEEYERQSKLELGAFYDTSDPDALTAYSLGIINGNGEGYFIPQGMITRQQAATMLARTGKLLRLSSGQSIDFADKGTFASWASGSIAYVSGLVDPVSSNAVMGGTGNFCFSPDDSYTREQAIITSLRLWHCVAQSNGLTPSRLITGEDALLKKLHDAVWNGDRELKVKISDYFKSLDEVGSTINRVGKKIYYMPDLFALEKITFSWDSSELTIGIRYNNCYGTEYTEAKSIYVQGISDIAAQVPQGLSDVETVFFVNSYFATHYMYDETYVSSDALGLILYGAGTCSAYANAIQAVFHQLGIPAGRVDSVSINHTWNIVKVGGKWYHMDTTWDDPSPDIYGQGFSSFLLLSTEAMKRAFNYAHFQADDWEYSASAVCDDTSFDSCAWRNTISPMVNISGTWFCVCRDGLISWNGSGQNYRTVFQFETAYDSWYPNYAFTNYVSASGLFLYGNNLYFNSSFNIIKYNLSTGEATRCTEILTDGSNIISCYYDQAGSQLILSTTDGKYYRFAA